MKMQEYTLFIIRPCIISYPWASTVAMLLDKIKSFLRFQQSENKARDKRLLTYMYLPWQSFLHKGKTFPDAAEGIFGMEDVAKVRNYF